MPSKTELRAEMRARLRDARPERDANSQVLCGNLVQRPAYQRAKTVAIFDPLPSEPDVGLLWRLGPREFYYPRIVNARLLFFQVIDPGELQPSGCGLSFREPADDEHRRLELSDLDLILVPGLAFTADGHRLGRGGGYYDRFLAALPRRTTRIGICFRFQVVPEMPSEPHDQRVDDVLTD